MTPVNLWAPETPVTTYEYKTVSPNIPDDLDLHYDMFIEIFLIFQGVKLTNRI